MSYLIRDPVVWACVVLLVIGYTLTLLQMDDHLLFFAGGAMMGRLLAVAVVTHRN